MKVILKEQIFDAKIEFILKEALGIVKKDFDKLIIDVIKKKNKNNGGGGYSEGIRFLFDRRKRSKDRASLFSTLCIYIEKIQFKKKR